MKISIWIFAFLLTLSAAVYQRLTGPTYPIKTVIDTGVQKFPVKFPRSFGGTENCPIVIKITDITVQGYLQYRKYPTKDSLTRVDFKREGDQLEASLPNQPPAGKLEYQVHLEKDGKSLSFRPDKPIVIRFKGEVPESVLIPHILLMFLAMFFSNAAGILALFKVPSYKTVSVITFIIIVIGGFVLGPIVQKYAFNEWWAGIPYGYDLTDNKTMVAIFAWLLALVMLKKNSSAMWVIAAALVTIAIFSIPHSLFGSQLDQESGKIIQGSILPFLQLF